MFGLQMRECNGQGTVPVWYKVGETTGQYVGVPYMFRRNGHRAPTTGAPCGHVLCQVCRAQIVMHARNGPTCHACRMPYDTVIDTPETSG
ncbi:uncharacterized protein EI90DRAFT_3069668 [Cantharellus anzutake]|uniref:uncharacterized protein n=1 Tax=Cantharellus anzutake TaxID=1750568 RepID=UPI001905B8A5|nr:uncharacterized protein EI90DRAFT_3069668 [Cantharellus anzutake]KAF8326557.1 hypothetical protein EI90DRAFT_3069668 [Cantharellus anzutake]